MAFLVKSGLGPPPFIHRYTPLGPSQALGDLSWSSASLLHISLSPESPWPSVSCVPSSSNAVSLWVPAIHSPKMGQYTCREDWTVQSLPWWVMPPGGQYSWAPTGDLTAVYIGICFLFFWLCVQGSLWQCLGDSRLAPNAPSAVLSLPRVMLCLCERNGHPMSPKTSTHRATRETSGTIQALV